MFGWGKLQVEGAMERGILKKTDTVEKLAAQLYIPAKNLQGSIDASNATAGSADDEFGRPEASCCALEVPQRVDRAVWPAREAQGASKR